MSGFTFEGIGGFEAGINALIAAVDAATKLAVTSGAHLIEANAKQSMNGPGPQVQTGTLRRSISVVDTTSLGAGVWKARVAPTVIYGRRMELGFHGQDSLGRTYNQRAYPFMRPGLQKSIGQLDGVFAAAWNTALHI